MARGYDLLYAGAALLGIRPCLAIRVPRSWYTGLA
jgi:hypothetical protein